MPTQKTLLHKGSSHLEITPEHVDLDTNEVIYQRLNASLSDIAALCDRWHIQEFSLFGSVIRDDFHSDSDIDVLVVFDSDNKGDWIDDTPAIQGIQRIYVQTELEMMFGRKVDFTEKHSLKNPFSRQEILRT